MFSALLLSALLGGLTLWFWVNSKPKKFPPGPVGLPIVGHIPLLVKEPYKTLMKWREIYGPIIGLSLGSYRVVFIHDPKLIREAMNKHELSARPEILEQVSRVGLSAHHSKQLAEQRSFFLKVMREFGSRRQSLDVKISDETSALLNYFRATTGKPCELQFVFNINMLSTLCSIMFSETLDQNDSEANEIIRKMSMGSSNINIINGLTLFFPWMTHIVPKKKSIKFTLESFFDNLQGFVRNKLNKHQAGYIRNNPRNVADAYEDKVQKTEDITSPFHPRHGCIIPTLSELLAGGLDTTSKSLQWIIAYLINYPEVQKQLQGDIDAVIGHNRFPSLSDRPSMNYTEAVIHEVLRHCSMIATSVPHRALEDVEFHGYVIPKDAIVMVNLYSCNHDKDIWGDPENFRPEHFLDNDKRFVSHPDFFPFGTGKRVCPGESFAKDQLFLFITRAGKSRKTR